MSKIKKSAKDFAAFRIDPTVNKDLHDWCMLHNTSFSALMELLAVKFNSENPLSEEDKAAIEKMAKDTEVIDALRKWAEKTMHQQTKK